MVAQDDSSIGNDELLHRRVLHNLENFLVFDSNIGRWTPGNAALRFDPDLSVYLSSEMERLSLSAESILEYPKAAVVFAVEAGGVRAEGFGVERSPVLPSSKPLDLAHGSVYRDLAWNKSEFQKRRNSIRKQFELMAGDLPSD
ncbi:MAG: hypothetical protein OXE04_01880 [bacterium]|nr:hypothetical protein [bacterium]